MREERTHFTKEVINRKCFIQYEFKIIRCVDGQIHFVELCKTNIIDVIRYPNMILIVSLETGSM